MLGIVEVRDKDEKGFLTVRLSDFLRVVEPYGRNLIWSILDLEARSDPDGFQGDLATIEQQIKLSPEGLIFGWDDLVAFSDTLIEVLDGLVVGCKDRNSIPRLVPGDGVFSQCEIGVEVVDSDVWRVYSREEAVLQAISAAFREVTFVPLS